MSSNHENKQRLQWPVLKRKWLPSLATVFRPKGTAAAALVATSLVGCTSGLPQDGADMVFVNGKIYTQNSQQPWAQALAIESKKIAFVGDTDKAQPLIGQNTQVIDLDGQLVLPGFIDTHAHPVMAAGSAGGVEFDLNQTPEHWLNAIKEHAQANPDSKGIIGFGFLAAAFGPNGPTKEMLDEIEPDRPIILMDEGGHSAWVNSKAFELAGIDRNTPDPIPGTHFYKRDEQGELTGWCLEAMTFMPMMAQLGLVDKASVLDGADDVFYLFSSFGITTIYDAGFSAFADTSYAAVDQLAKENRLPFRLVTSHMIQSPAHLPDAVATLSDYQKRYASELVQPRVMKIHNDGTKEAKTAGQFEHYAGEPDNFGSVLLEGEVLQNFVKEVDQAGFDIHIHAIGDRAIDEALDAFEAARNLNPESRNRYSVAHTELVRDEDLARFGELDVVAQTTPAWFATDGEFEIQMLGKERAEKLYRFRKIIDAGGKVSFGSDFPATGSLQGLAPIVNMEMGQTRKYPGEREMPVTPPVDATLTLPEMIRGYTIDAAYQLNMEQQLGSLEEGKLADFVVVNENLFEMDVYDINEAKVSMTVMNGEVVFERNLKARFIEWLLDL
jgi:predicted amidohydrolase YtcJ